MGKKRVNVNKKRDKRKGKIKEKDKENDRDKEENKADFYLDDEDADLAYNSSELEEESEHGSELDFNEEDYTSSEVSNEETTKQKQKDKGITKDELKSLVSKTTEGNKTAIIKMVYLFNKVTIPNDSLTIEDESEIPKEKRNILSNQKVVSNLIKFCIDTFPSSLNKKSQCGWYKQTAKKYISIIAKYIKICEPAMQEFIFSNIDSFENIILLFSNYTEIFIKYAIQLWTKNPKNDIGIKCFTFISKTISSKQKFFEYSIKLFYINYLNIAKAMNIASYNHIHLLQRDIINFLKIDLKKAYITIFTFIRKLCIQLRLTIIDKTTSSIKSIYNWQFVNSLILWGKAVSAYAKDDDIAMLAYPLIQTIIGVIRLNYGEQFYLLRIRLSMLLNEISKNTNIYIPISMYMLPILSSNYFVEKCKEEKNKNKNKGSNNRRVNILTNIKIKKEEFKVKQIRKDLLEECCDTLMEFLSVNCGRICFEDIAFLILKEMRMALKKIYDKEYRSIIKGRMEKIEKQVDKVREVFGKEENCVNLIKRQTVEDMEKILKKNSEIVKEFDVIKHRREENFEAIKAMEQKEFIEIK